MHVKRLLPPAVGLYYAHIMARRRIVITGATSGIGLESARQLAATGAHLILACRDLVKAEPVRAELAASSAGTVDLVHLDLADLASVEQCANELTGRYDGLDVLINNAGVFRMRRELTRDGLELTMATNHLGPFLLTNRLLPLLERGSRSRVVNVASAAYRYGHVDPADLQLEHWNGGMGWGGFQAYAASRLATVLFTRELANRVRANGITANSCHPGHVATNIFPVAGGLMGTVMRITSRFRISVRDGAAPIVRLAIADDVADVTGMYFHRFEPEAIPARLLKNDAQRRLWAASERLIGLP